MIKSIDITPMHVRVAVVMLVSFLYISYNVVCLIDTCRYSARCVRPENRTLCRTAPTLKEKGGIFPALTWYAIFKNEKLSNKSQTRSETLAHNNRFHSVSTRSHLHSCDIP